MGEKTWLQLPKCVCKLIGRKRADMIGSVKIQRKAGERRRPGFKFKENQVHDVRFYTSTPTQADTFYGAQPSTVFFCSQVHIRGEYAAT